LTEYSFDANVFHHEIKQDGLMAKGLYELGLRLEIYGFIGTKAIVDPPVPAPVGEEPEHA